MGESTPLCSACGLPGHRYGTTDTEHGYSATACINGLRSEIRVLSETLLTFARRQSGDLAVLRVVEAIAAERERIYARHGDADA